MTGVALPGGAVLYGDGDQTSGVCVTGDGTGIDLPGGGVMAGGSACDSLTSDAVLYINAGFGTATNHGTAGQVLNGAGTWAVIEPQDWDGEALVGLTVRDTPYAQSEGWFTDLDVSATFAMPPHHARNPAGEWSELFHIPKTGGGGETEWVEYAVLLKADGTLRIGIDASESSFTWQSDPIGDWDTGFGVTVWRLTIEASGDITLYRDGEVFQTDTVGAVTFAQPPDGEEVQVGPFQYAPIIQQITLLDGIDGDTVISWEPEDTGWTPGIEGSYVGPSLPEPFLWAGDGELITVVDNAALNIAADQSATLAAWFHAVRIVTEDVTTIDYLIRETGTLGQNGNGYVVRDLKFDPFADGMGGIIGDGSDQGIAISNTGWDVGDHLVVMVIDRTIDRLTVYVDGTSHATADISAVGAINPSAALTFGRAPWYAVALFDDIVSPTRIASWLGA